MSTHVPGVQRRLLRDEEVHRGFNARGDQAGSELVHQLGTHRGLSQHGQGPVQVGMAGHLSDKCWAGVGMAGNQYDRVLVRQMLCVRGGDGGKQLAQNRKIRNFVKLRESRHVPPPRRERT